MHSFHIVHHGLRAAVNLSRLKCQRFNWCLMRVAQTMQFMCFCWYDISQSRREFYL